MSVPHLLSSLKLLQLRTLSLRMGLPVSGTKGILISNISSLPPPPPPMPIISIDMGIRNLAFCALSPTFDILAWRRLNFPVPTDLRTFADLAYTVTSDLLKEFPGTGQVLIEKQRWRSGGGAHIQQWTVSVNTFEAMLYAFLYRREGVCVESVDPGKVARCVGAQGKAEKKAFVAGFVGGLKGDKEMWKDKGKKDDLADCLLQAWVWSRWMDNRREFLDRGRISGGGEEDALPVVEKLKPKRRARKMKTEKE